MGDAIKTNAPALNTDRAEAVNRSRDTLRPARSEFCDVGVHSGFCERTAPAGCEHQCTKTYNEYAKRCLGRRFRGCRDGKLQPVKVGFVVTGAIFLHAEKCPIQFAAGIGCAGKHHIVLGSGKAAAIPAGGAGGTSWAWQMWSWSG